MLRIGRLLLLAGIAVYLLLPIMAVVLYAVATRWSTHLLPDGYTMQHWQTALTDPRLIAVMLRTLGLAIAVTLLVNLLVIPAVYWQWTVNPRIRHHVELIAMIPFALPYVVIAFSILLLSGMLLPFAQGTVWLLLLAHGAIAFPFLYWAVDGAMAAAQVPLLVEAAQTCGASPGAILRRVVLPNIATGIATGSMLVFATSFNEFALVQILVGDRFETLSLYSLDLLTSANADFNQLAVVTCLMFGTVLLISVASLYWDGGQKQISQRFISGNAKKT
jgi:putative spermidine/putrescine transport system permease protein